MVVLSRVEITFCHAHVSVREPGCCCDSRFETYTIKREKVLISAIALSRGHVSLICTHAGSSSCGFEYVGHVS